MSAVFQQFESLKGLRDSIVPLLPELQAYYNEDNGFPCIQHPLVYSMLHTPTMNAWANDALQRKREIIAERKEAGEHTDILTLYERPYRINAFMDMQDGLTDREYWESLGWIYTDSENLHQNRDEWRELLNSDRPDRLYIMGAEDRTALALMKNPIRVYRGKAIQDGDGFSWTTNLKKARWFANRNAELRSQSTHVITGTIRRKHVIAYLTNRGESEIVAMPERVYEQFVESTE